MCPANGLFVTDRKAFISRVSKKRFVAVLFPQVGLTTELYIPTLASVLIRLISLRRSAILLALPVRSSTSSFKLA